jgi:hypothetical protein
MAELMVMETASQLCLFQVSGDVLVRHFLKASLKKVHLLSYDSGQSLYHIKHVALLSAAVPTYFIFAPSSSSSGRCQLPALGDAELMAIQDVARGRIGCARVRSKLHWWRHYVSGLVADQSGELLKVK